MSSRALRRLKGKQRGQEAIDLGYLQTDEGEQAPDLEEEQGQDDCVLEPAKKTSSRKAKKNKSQKNISNIYELICDAENDTEKQPTDEEAAASFGHHSSEESKEKSDSCETEKGDELTETAKGTCKAGNKANKKKKKKKKKSSAGEMQEEQAAGDDIDALLETIEKANGVSYQNESCGSSDNRSVLYVEHRNLNPETELKRYFGARAVLGDQRPRQRQRQFHRSTWMTILKDTWPRFSRPGVRHHSLSLAYQTMNSSKDNSDMSLKTIAEDRIMLQLVIKSPSPFIQEIV